MLWSAPRFLERHGFEPEHAPSGAPRGSSAEAPRKLSPSTAMQQATGSRSGYSFKKNYAHSRKNWKTTMLKTLGMHDWWRKLWWMHVIMNDDDERHRDDHVVHRSTPSAADSSSLIIIDFYFFEIIRGKIDKTKSPCQRPNSWALVLDLSPGP